MSASGTYAYWPKVNNPNAVLPQMTSDTQQKPFFFGGSQVPINLGLDTNSHTKTLYKSHVEHSRELDAQGRGIGTTVRKNHKVYLAKNMPSISK